MRTLLALVLTKLSGLGCQARHQGHWHKTTQKNRGFCH